MSHILLVFPERAERPFQRPLVYDFCLPKLDADIFVIMEEAILVSCDMTIQSTSMITFSGLGTRNVAHEACRVPTLDFPIVV